MNILHIAPYKILPPNSGGERCIYFSLKRFSEKIQIVSLTTSANDKPCPIKFDIVFPDSVSRYANPFIIKTIQKKLKEYQAEILYIEHPFMALWPSLFYNSLKIKLVVKSHNIEYLRFKSQKKWYWPIIKFVERKAHRRADYSLFVTNEDMNFAISDFALDKEKCFFMPYGVEQKELPDSEEISRAKAFICNAHNINPSDKILLFNGSLGYFPNEKAVENIVENINPQLKKEFNNYKILICGKGLKQELVDKIEAESNIIYTGFVDDIDVYFKACDVMVNPVVEGGGVKTKLVEAIGFGKAVVSYKSGSYGVDTNIAGGRLKIVDDYDVVEFCNASIEAMKQNFDNDNSLFYEEHNWDKIVDRVIVQLEKL